MSVLQGNVTYIVMDIWISSIKDIPAFKSATGKLAPGRAAVLASFTDNGKACSRSSGQKRVAMRQPFRYDKDAGVKRYFCPRL